MLRNLLSRSRTPRLIYLTCLLSLCANLFFLVSKRQAGNVDHNQFKLANSRGLQEFYQTLLLEKNASLEERDEGPDTEAASVEQNEHTAPTTQAPTQGQHMNGCSLCPYHPPDLLGPLADMVKEMSPESLKIIFREMKDGRLSPVNCTAREKIAIVIPYRNRYPHLHIFLHNLIPFLIRQQADARFFVIEQALPGTFNRGALLNAGFLEASKVDLFDCFIFHDVDLIPLNDRHLYRCGDNPKHLAVSMNKYNFRMPYRDYFGGAVAFSRTQYQDINGCSNVYFGWGGEDDEMMQRVLNSGYIITRAPMHIARYDMIKHTRDKGNEVNPVRKYILSTARKRQQVEGLNTLKYKVNDVKVDQLYIWVTVTFNQTEILQSAPPYVLKAMVESQRKKAIATSHRPNTTSGTRSQVKSGVHTNMAELSASSTIAANNTS